MQIYNNILKNQKKLHNQLNKQYILYRQYLKMNITVFHTYHKIDGFCL